MPDMSLALKWEVVYLIKETSFLFSFFHVVTQTRIQGRFTDTVTVM